MLTVCETAAETSAALVSGLEQFMKQLLKWLVLLLQKPIGAADGMACETACERVDKNTNVVSCNIGSCNILGVWNRSTEFHLVQRRQQGFRKQQIAFYLDKIFPLYGHYLCYIYKLRYTKADKSGKLWCYTWAAANEISCTTPFPQENSISKEQLYRARFRCPV